MTKKDIWFFEKVAAAMAKCPRIASGIYNPTTTAGAINKSYNDFANINFLAGLAMSEYLSYMSKKIQLKDDMEGLDLDLLKKLENEGIEAYSILGDLEEYVLIRSNEGWN